MMSQASTIQATTKNQNVPFLPIFYFDSAACRVVSNKNHNISNL
jgi:hypothetical protein